MTVSYHEGEIEMQRRAGVRVMAERVSRIIAPDIPPAAAAFLAAQPFVIVATVDAGGATTASLLQARARATDDREITIETPFAYEGTIGILAIDLATRRRMRANGTAVRRGDALVVTTSEVYSNCPQYIHPRRFDGRVITTRAFVLTKELERADTFFLATSHPGRGPDASHRGGEPGFVHVDSPTTLWWPDYPGNNMFNSLGNLLVNPRCGLLFVDFENHRALQLQGTATIEGDEERIIRFELSP